MSTASTAVARGTAGRWLRPALRFTGMVYLQTLLWLGVWVLVPVSVFGYQAVALDSNSMAPAMRAGDVLLLEDYDGRPLDVGRIVTFGDIARDGRLVTHRIVGQNDDGTLQTKGDANRSADSTPVDPARISGVGRLVVPLVGLPVVWASTGQWAAFAAWAGLSGMVLAFLLPGTSGTRRDRRVRRRQPRPQPLAPPAAPPPTAPVPQRLDAPTPRPLASPAPVSAQAPPRAHSAKAPAVLRLPEPPKGRFAVVPPPPQAPRDLRLPEPPERPVLPAPPARSRLLAPRLPSERALRPLPVAPLPRAPQRGLAPPTLRTRRWALPLHLLLVVGVLAAGPLATSAAAALRATTQNTGNTATAHTLGTPAAPSLTKNCPLIGSRSVTITASAIADPAVSHLTVRRVGFGQIGGALPPSGGSVTDTNGPFSGSTFTYFVRAHLASWTQDGPTNSVSFGVVIC